MSASNLNRRIQIQRASRTIQPGGSMLYEWSDHGSALPAQRKDISDAERVRGGSWDNKLVSRFVVRDSAFSRGIRRTDRLMHEGVIFEIDGIKEVPQGRKFLEITAWSEDVL